MGKVANKKEKKKKRKRFVDLLHSQPGEVQLSFSIPDG